MKGLGEYPYRSQRMPVMAGNVVATSQPLAAQAGLRMMPAGGNAVDAALATAIALAVVEPTNNGIGGDAFAIVWEGERLVGINGSGRSPAGWSPERFAGRERMPDKGWDAVTVPGAVSLWAELSERYGRLEFERLFEPAIAYARGGYMVSPLTAAGWAGAVEAYAEYPEFAEAFLPGGKAPAAGEVFRCEAQAETLEKIAATRGETFYRGEIAKRIAAHSRECGGAMTQEDLAAHRSQWVEPIGVDYGEVRVHEIPPNGQGLAALVALGILRHLDIGRYAVDSADSVHLQMEAMKVGFAEAHRHVAEPVAMEMSVEELLDEGRLAERARGISVSEARFPKASVPTGGGTVYLAAADAGGMMVSLIQSNFGGFGSGVVVPGTGIAMQNRGAGFVLEEGHPNRVAGGKRPYHTIIPGFVTRGGAPLMCLGVMGGHQQPQGHVQMVLRIFDYGQNVQSALDGPRWHVWEDFRVSVEEGLRGVVDELRQRGHEVVEGAGMGRFGGGQLICKVEGGYVAGSEYRKDGQAVGY